MDAVKLLDFKPHEESDEVIEIFVTEQGSFECTWQGEKLTGDLHSIKVTLTKQARVKARKIRIDVGNEAGENYVLVGMHANGAEPLARRINAAGKLEKAKVGRWDHAYLPWTPDLLTQKLALAFAVKHAEEELAAFMDTREIKSENGRHMQMRDVIQEEIDMPETIAARLLKGTK